MKYIIELEDEPRKELFADAGNYYRCKQRPFWFISEDTRDSLTPYTEPDCKAIEDEVWEFAKQVSIMKPEDKEECWGTAKYNTINLGYSYQEAKARYEAWKEQIRVGDEVFYLDDPDKEKAVVLRRYQPPQYKPLVDILCEGGIFIKQVVVENLVRTGRHFDEVEELLKKMKE